MIDTRTARAALAESLRAAARSLLNASAIAVSIDAPRVADVSLRNAEGLIADAKAVARGDKLP